MFDNIKKKIDNMKVEAQKRREEEERLEKEKIEQEKQRLLALNEKELLVEIIFMMKGIVKEHESLIEKIEELERSVSDIELKELNKDIDSYM